MRKLFGGLAALVLAISLSACGGSGSGGPTTVGDNHTITVDGMHGLAAMIDAGHYGWTNSDVNDANFKITPAKRDEVMALVSFNRNISSENAVAEMKARGLRPANLDECLAYGATIADTGSIHPIICLGQSAQIGGDREVPDLWDDRGTWELILAFWDNDWGSDCRFLAVRA
jgi:hypothetical protein